MAKIDSLDFAEYVKDNKNALKNNLRAYNVDVDDSMSLANLVDAVNVIPSVPQELYKIQDDIPEMPDLFKLADNDPDIGNKPTVIVVVPDYLLKQTITVTPSSIVKTSDGKIYTNDTSSQKAYTHIWDLSKDIDTSFNFKLRWIETIDTTGYATSRIQTIHTGFDYGICIASYIKNMTIEINPYALGYPDKAYLYFDNCKVTMKEFTSQGLTTYRAIFTRNCEITKTKQLPFPFFYNYKFYDSYFGNPIIDTLYIPNAYMQSYNVNNYIIKTIIDDYGNWQYASALFFKTANTTTQLRLNTSSSSLIYLICISITFLNMPLYKSNLLYDYLPIEVTFDEEITDNILLTNSNTYLLSRKSMLHIIDKLADMTGSTTKTFKINSKALENLTEEEIAVATNKNWTLS